MLGALLTACAGGPDPEQAQGCPRVAIVADAARAETFRPGPGRDLTDLASRAQIIRISGSCVYDDDRVTIAVRMPIVVERGPAFASGQADYAYFVAVTDRDSNVLAKRTFPISLGFEGGSGFAGAIEEVEQVIPLQNPAQGTQYQVLLGLALDREQLTRNLAD